MIVRLEATRDIELEIQSVITKAIADIGIKNFYTITGNVKEYLAERMRLNVKYGIVGRYSPTLLYVESSEINPVQKIIVSDLMESLRNYLKEDITTEIVASDITYYDEESIDELMNHLEYDHQKESDNKLYLYFLSKGFEQCSCYISNSLQSRLTTIRVNVIVNKKSIKLLLDKVYKYLSFDFTDFEKTLISNFVKDDIDKLPEVICEVLNKRYSNITLADFNTIMEKAHKYDELMNS